MYKGDAEDSFIQKRNCVMKADFINYAHYRVKETTHHQHGAFP